MRPSIDFIMLWCSIITVCGVQRSQKNQLSSAVVKLVETYVSGESQFLCYVLSGVKEKL